MSAAWHEALFRRCRSCQGLGLTDAASPHGSAVQCPECEGTGYVPTPELRALLIAGNDLITPLSREAAAIAASLSELSHRVDNAAYQLHAALDSISRRLRTCLP